MHRDFFKGDSLFEIIKNHAGPYTSEKKKTAMIRALACPLFQVKEAYMWYIETDAYMEDSRPNQDRALAMFNLFVCAGRIWPSRHSILWLRQIVCELRILMFCMMEPRMSVEYRNNIMKRLEPFFKGSDPVKAVIVLSAAMMDASLNLDAAAEVQRVALNMWRLVADSLVTLTNTRCLIGEPIEEIMKVIDETNGRNKSSQWHRGEVRAAFEEALRKAARRERQGQRKRVEVFKEELMQVCWHPRRVERALEMGYDIDDM
jgi:hypothetical protein